jgi:hypothetical protein
VPGYGPKAHLSVTIDFNDLKMATANATGALVFGDTLSAATIRRLACDAEVLPIVLGSGSQPLDVGTSQRLVTRPMRRVLNARDKGCVVCGAPPIQCDAHHVISWLDGGVTAVSNLVLLCRRHHRDLHDGHWQIRIIDGVVHVTRPSWADPDCIPRGKYRPPTSLNPQTHRGRSIAARLEQGAPGSSAIAATPINLRADDSLPAVETQAQPRPRPQSPHFDLGDDDARSAATCPPAPQPAAFDPWGDDSPPGARTNADAGPSERSQPARFEGWGDDNPSAALAETGASTRSDEHLARGGVEVCALQPSA